MNKCKSIIYIGDFDLRNENVQAHLVLNNGKIFNQLGYKVFFIGINRNAVDFSVIESLEHYQIPKNEYVELPNTLNLAGVMRCHCVCRYIVERMEEINRATDVRYVITYQAPTYAVVLKKIVKWSKGRNIPYIVNCADIPIFDNQPFTRRIVMKPNWDYMHKVNKRNADGIIAVSSFIEKFYHKDGCPSVIIPPLVDTSTVMKTSRTNDVPTFIYAGTPFNRTGKRVVPNGMKDRLDIIIDLFLELSRMGINYALNVVGISKDEYIIGIPQHCDEIKINSSIKFYGRCSHEETLSFIAGADFSINYRDENVMTMAGYSTKIVESVSLGTPVVINDIGDTFKYLEDHVSGIKLSTKKDEAVKALVSLCNLSVSERAEIKVKCSNTRPFDWEKFVSAIKYFLLTV